MTAQSHTAGPLDGEGWVLAPEGGWSENPVPGAAVFIRQDDGWESKTSSPWWQWSREVMAYRIDHAAISKATGEAGQ